jgi:hypothetical protein
MEGMNQKMYNICTYGNVTMKPPVNLSYTNENAADGVPQVVSVPA